jgi:hypothetical protein
MSEENQRPIMSQSVVNSGSESIKGFLNLEEFMRALLRGVGQSSAISLGVAVLLSLGDSVHLWYTGPLAPTVIACAGIIVGYLRTKRLGERLIAEGDDLDSR